MKIAAKQPLAFTRESLTKEGHAIEVRIYAENPSTFFPSPGTITTLELPTGEGVRHECGVESGSVVTPFYDPMISKLVVGKQEKLPVKD